MVFIIRRAGRDRRVHCQAQAGWPESTQFIIVIARPGPTRPGHILAYSSIQTQAGSSRLISYEFITPSGTHYLEEELLNLKEVPSSPRLIFSQFIVDKEQLVNLEAKMSKYFAFMKKNSQHWKIAQKTICKWVSQLRSDMKWYDILESFWRLKIPNRPTEKMLCQKVIDFVPFHACMRPSIRPAGHVVY